MLWTRIVHNMAASQEWKFKTESNWKNVQSESIKITDKFHTFEGSPVVNAQ